MRLLQACKGQLDQLGGRLPLGVDLQVRRVTIRRGSDIEQMDDLVQRGLCRSDRGGA